MSIILTRSMTTLTTILVSVLALSSSSSLFCHALIPFLDGGKDIPKLYNGYFNSQIAKQAATAVGAAISSGKINIEVNLPPVPNVEEVRFGTPLNKKFGKTVVAKDLKVQGGYFPGSDISRQQLSYANIYWAKQIAGSVGGGVLGGKPVSVLSADPMDFENIKSKGAISKLGPMRTKNSGGPRRNSNSNNESTLADACIVVNPGGEETWDRLKQSLTKKSKVPLCGPQQRILDHLRTREQEKIRGSLLLEAHHEGVDLSGLSRSVEGLLGKAGRNYRTHQVL
mmetsp:Transcript_17364/g.38041  ORF Transcript_17364/g.38041 Transcript_17364/m.38041 type:complete len:282 (+) Transcript_17364:212-1057(+)